MIHLMLKPLRLSLLLKTKLILLALLLCQFQPCLAEDETEKFQLKVLYAGNPGSSRMLDFERLLQKYFVQVGVTNFEKFTIAEAKPFDVIVFDWTSTYPRDANGKMVFGDNFSMNSPRTPNLGSGFDRPVVMIGEMAGSISHKQKMAINWKCLCLDDAAHNINAEHPIFNKPLMVSPLLVERKKPHDYYLYPGTKTLSETIKVLPMQTKTFPETDPGLVSTYETFVDTVDAEAISGGINGKGPTSVAIGRHANFFLWGFSAQPSDMTESARKLFINSICYMDQFDGKTPGEVKRRTDGRKSFLGMVYFMRSVSDDYVAEMVRRYEENTKENPPSQKQLDEIGDDKPAYFRKMYSKYVEEFRKKIPEDVLTACENNTEKLIDYYEANLEYLIPSGEQMYKIDDEVKKLGISNRDVSLIEKCISLVDDSKSAPMAMKILLRYTNQTFADATQWKAWWKSNQTRVRYDESSEKFITP